MKLKHYDLLAALLEHPKKDYLSIVNSIESQINNYSSEIKNIYRNFISLVSELSIEKTEELYIRTFDVQAVTTLDVGYVLFGDDYKRGELLVNLTKEHKKYNNNCGTELADFLPNLLHLIPKIDQEDLLVDLVGYILTPALHKMINEFDLKNIQMKNGIYIKKYKTLIEQPEVYSRLFLFPLILVLKILEEDFNAGQNELEDYSTTYTDSIINEIKID